jgi:glutathione peroxidase-family protein
LPVWAREVNGEIEKRWGMAFKRFSRVIVVGGGALLLNEYLTHQFNGKAVLPDNPVLSIARGLYKLLLMKR